MSFTDDFQKYCTTIQPRFSRIILTFIIGVGLMTYGEVNYLRTLQSLQVLGCGEYTDQSSWSGSYSTISIDTCFHANMTQCITGQYDALSKTTLSFTVPFFGVPNDKYGKILGALLFISYIFLQGSLQSFGYLATMKRKRIQDILGKSKVYILVNKKKAEIIRALIILFAAITYTGLKVLVTLNRQDYYSKIECSGVKYHLSFTLAPSYWIGTIILTFVIFIFMVLQYISTVINFLSDMDLRNLLVNLKPTSLAQLADITVIPIDLFERVINRQVDKNYLYLSYFPRFIKKSIFFLPQKSVTDEEIVKYVLHYKSQNPNAFYPYNVLLSDIDKNGADDLNNYDGENGRLL